MPLGGKDDCVPIRVRETRDEMQERIEQLERENRELRRELNAQEEEFDPADGVFKACGNRVCGNKVQYGTKYCPPCRMI